MPVALRVTERGPVRGAVTEPVADAVADRGNAATPHAIPLPDPTASHTHRSSRVDGIAGRLRTPATWWWGSGPSSG